MAEMRASGLPSQTLIGKVAIVTGSSRGLGAVFALDLAKRGAKIVISYTSPSSQSAADTLVKDIISLPNHTHASTTDPAAISVRADLSSVDGPARLISEVTKVYQHIDILVNNAGTDITLSLADATPEAFAKVYDVNVRAPLLLTSALLPYLRHPARIINIGSVGARAGFAQLGLYCSSKAALEGLTRVWAAELGDRGTTVNCVNGGPVPSDMLDQIPPEIVDAQKKATPIEKRLGTAEDIAEVVGWLASEGSRWVTGQVISASGGWAMY